MFPMVLGVSGKYSLQAVYPVKKAIKARKTLSGVHI